MLQRREELFAEIESDETEEDSEDDPEDIDDEISAGDIPDSGVEDGPSEDEQQTLDPRRTRH
jgi:hypothetical protein